MDPNKWGRYGWKMIHSVSRLPIELEDYRKWLFATSRILPCRKCRRNFRRHLREDTCDNSKSPEYLSICLHDVVNAEHSKPTGRVVIQQLPAFSKKGMFEPYFLATLFLNTTIGKDKVIHEWFRETERILRIGGQSRMAEIVNSMLQIPIFTKKRDYERKLEMKQWLWQLFTKLGIKIPSNQDLEHQLGRSLRPRATRKRRSQEKRSGVSGKSRKLRRNLE